tara:strand:- start:536 stop:859 length:324 start_codon:yes stop_codon:yes gene_type:complete
MWIKLQDGFYNLDVTHAISKTDGSKNRDDVYSRHDKPRIYLTADSGSCQTVEYEDKKIMLVDFISILRALRGKVDVESNSNLFNSYSVISDARQELTYGEVDPLESQ